MKAALLRAVQWMCAVAVSAAMALPLVSLFQHPTVAVSLEAIVAGVGVLAAAWPAVGVLALTVLLPLAVPIEYFLGPAPAATAITEALLLAFGCGAALRLGAARSETADRLSRPALAFGALIVASAAIGLVGEQAASPNRDVAAELWRHVTDRYLFAIGSWGDVHQAIRWISVLALGVFAERALKRSPAFAPMVARMFLVGGAAAASFAALRVTSLLLEGRISQDRWVIVQRIIGDMRISALHPDANAAGSYFLLILVPALILMVRHRSVWIALGVLPLVGVAFAVAQSRAALLAAGLVIGIVIVGAMMKARRYVLAASVVVTIAVLAVVASAVTRESHASVGRASGIRVEMSKLAFEITRDHPLFGTGVGSFREVSRHYVTDRYPELERFSPNGQNAHNNFLQVLAELGIPGFVLFLWLVLPPARRWAWEPATAPDTAVYGSAFAAGLGAFLISAIFGHPLLIPQVAAGFFLVLALVAAMRPPLQGPRTTGRLVAAVVVLAVVVTMPWRVAEARRVMRDEEGVSRVIGTMDDVPYRRAEREAVWRLATDVRVVSVPLRWEEPAPAGCGVDVVYRGQVVNQVRPEATAWMPLRFSLPPASSPAEVRELRLRVSADGCRLLVGPLSQTD